MLHQFLTVNRKELIERCRDKVSLRRVPRATPTEMEHGIPLFLDQLIRTLQVEQMSDVESIRRISGGAGGKNPGPSELSEAATRHGREMQLLGFTVDQVVHDYGDLCQSITDLACEQAAPIDTDEFRTLNRCLDNAIADATTEYSYQRDIQRSKPGQPASNAEFGQFVHEIRNHINTAMLALSAIKLGGVGVTGATSGVLERSLISLHKLVDRSLLDVRARAGIPEFQQLLSLSRFIANVKISALLEAQAHDVIFNVSEVDPVLAIRVDEELMFSAVSNLLQNAFKFTKPGTEVTLNAFASADRILIEVHDHCGGLPPGGARLMSQPFVQGHPDRSGLGLGLVIVRRNVEAVEGKLAVRDEPGKGCVFTIDLPRYVMPEPSPKPEPKTEPKPEPA